MAALQFTSEQRVFIVETFIRTNSYVDVVGEFQRRFPGRNPPTKKTIKYNVKKFRDRGSVLNQNANRSGRSRTGRSAENVALVRQALEDDPHVSARRNGIGLPAATFNRITRLDLNWYPYRMKVRHKLDERDYARRMNYGRWLIGMFEDLGFGDKIVIGDEATFSVNGKVNTHNIVQYAPKGEVPDFHYDVNNSREKVTAWAAVCGNGTILGPCFFDRNVNGEAYVNMLNDEIVQEMMLHFQFNLHGDSLFGDNVWWFQDGAGAHRHRIVTARLRQLFGHQVVAFDHEVEWPARSPDLTPCDFFLWGYIKSRVFTTPPPNVFSLRERIIQEFELLQQNPDLVARAVRSMRRRAQLCLDREGGHVEGQYA